MRNGEADDWWWWLRFTAHGHKAVQVPESLFHYRQTGISMSLPWSEGQGALTTLRVCEVVREAAVTSRLDARHIAQIAEEAIALAYKRTWECDTLRRQLPLRAQTAEGHRNACGAPQCAARAYACASSFAVWRAQYNSPSQCCAADRSQSAAGRRHGRATPCALASEPASSRLRPLLNAGQPTTRGR